MSTPDANYNYPPSHNPVPQEDRNWTMIAHVVPLVAMAFSAGLLGFIAGIVIYIMAQDKSYLVKNAAAQSLNIQLNALIYLIISYVLIIVLIGFILIPIVIVWAAALHIIALVKASRGEVWKPPFCIRFFS